MAETDAGYAAQKAKIAENITRIRSELAQLCSDLGTPPPKILAATKTVPPDLIDRAIECGVDAIGENRAQELIEKYDRIRLRDRVPVHFIGRLQTNKVRQIIGLVDMIESVDRPELAREIDLRAGQAGKRMDVLIEVSCTGEEAKGGVEYEKLDNLVDIVLSLPNINLCGYMTIPPADASGCKLVNIYRNFNKKIVDIGMKKRDNKMYIAENKDAFRSMGMSGDWRIAVSQGSGQIRLGSAIFGKRPQPGADIGYTGGNTNVDL